jgi:hypothetical protein
MMFKLKLISRTAIPTALAKAEKYRLLNEPGEAESICRDVLAIDPADQRALVMLLLALTDQFRPEAVIGVRHAEEALEGLRDGFERAYYQGIIRERWGRTLLIARDPGQQAYVWLRDAMRCYEEAETLSPVDNNDSILRWNACARLIVREALYEREEHIGLDHGDGAPSR